MEMLAYTLVCGVQLSRNSWKSLVVPAKQNHFFQENIFNNAPVRRIANAMSAKSAFTGSYTGNPFWYQQRDLRQIRTLIGSKPIVDFDADVFCRLYVTTIKAMNFQNDNLSIRTDYF